MKNMLKIFAAVSVLLVFVLGMSSFRTGNSAAQASAAKAVMQHKAAFVNSSMCTSCYGTGKCQGCMGYGNLKCSACDGSGRQSYTDGDGKTSSYTCSNCDGKGRVNCSVCVGTGKCGVCNGTGVLGQE